jgi:hypothetical protein
MEGMIFYYWIFFLVLALGTSYVLELVIAVCEKITKKKRSDEIVFLKKMSIVFWFICTMISCITYMIYPMF